MALLVESAAMALTIFVIGLLANYAGIIKKAEKGFEFIFAGAFLYLVVSAAQYTLPQFVVISETFVVIGGFFVLAVSLIALFCVVLGAFYAVEDLSREKKIVK